MLERTNNGRFPKVCEYALRLLQDGRIAADIAARWITAPSHGIVEQACLKQVRLVVPLRLAL